MNINMIIFEEDKYIDKSNLFFNQNTNELYIMFDGYFNEPIDDFTPFNI